RQPLPLRITARPLACIPPQVIFSLLSPRPARSILFPYTTLFRSSVSSSVGEGHVSEAVGAGVAACACCEAADLVDLPATTLCARSEEHTSELQSRENLVCRLLLEKKKIK